MGAMANIPGRDFSEEDLLKRLEEGKKCLGMKHRNELVGFTWIAYETYGYRNRQIPLKANEAYLFDAYTLEDYRGKGIAPYLRYRVYMYLAELGRNRFYSVTEYLNVTSIRFKEKLGARSKELYLYVQLFKNLQFYLPIKKF
jgi:GNAT superfamily N-acetyltransferase